jgi:flagellar basal body-associated protein FliL
MRRPPLAVCLLPFVLDFGPQIAFLKFMPEGRNEGKKKTKETPAKGGRSLLLILPTVILAAIGVWYWFGRSSESSAQANGVPRVKSTLHLETFILNLADTDQRSYLRVGIDLGLNREPKRGEEPAPVAEVRDVILGVLAEARVDDLMTADGKTKLKEKLLRALQERVPQLGVEEVYFTEFLIQR